MHPLERALTDLDEMASALDACLRDPLTAGIDAGLLSAWATERAALHDRLSHLERLVMAALEEAAGGDADLTHLAAVAPEFTTQLRERLASIAARVEQLRKQDAHRGQMLARARLLVRAYLTAIAPTPTAYGPSGASAQVELPASTRTKA